MLAANRGQIRRHAPDRVSKANAVPRLRTEATIIRRTESGQAAVFLLRVEEGWEPQSGEGDILVQGGSSGRATRDADPGIQQKGGAKHVSVIKSRVEFRASGIVPQLRVSHGTVLAF